MNRRSILRGLALGAVATPAAVLLGGQAQAARTAWSPPSRPPTRSTSGPRESPSPSPPPLELGSGDELGLVEPLRREAPQDLRPRLRRARRRLRRAGRHRQPHRRGRRRGQRPAVVPRARREPARHRADRGQRLDRDRRLRRFPRPLQPHRDQQEARSSAASASRDLQPDYKNKGHQRLPRGYRRSVQ